MLRKTCFSIKAPMTFYTVTTTKSFKSRLRCFQKSQAMYVDIMLFDVE